MNISQTDLQKYSLSRVLQQTLGICTEGIEAEFSRQLAKDNPQIPNGTLVPFSILGHHRRDMAVGTFGAGGATVGTQIQPNVIEILRNQTVAFRLGARVLTGLTGNTILPRQTGTVTVAATGETTAVNATNPTIEQVVLVPHRVACSCVFSKQLLLQSSVDIEAFVRQDIAAALAINVDRSILEGVGGNNEPTGVKSTPGINTVSFGGAPTWAKLLECERTLAAANALKGRVAFTTTPSVRSAWKATPKVAASAFPSFLWEPQQWSDGSDADDGIANGYRAACTNQISGNMVAFGDWSQVVVGIWGDGFDLTTDPYTAAVQGQVRVTLNMFLDVAIRHPQSFCWSTDAGNQS